MRAKKEAETTTAKVVDPVAKAVAELKAFEAAAAEQRERLERNLQAAREANPEPPPPPLQSAIRVAIQSRVAGEQARERQLKAVADALGAENVETLRSALRTL